MISKAKMSRIVRKWRGKRIMIIVGIPEDGGCPEKEDIMIVKTMTKKKIMYRKGQAVKMARTIFFSLLIDFPFVRKSLSCLFGPGGKGLSVDPFRPLAEGVVHEGLDGIIGYANGSSVPIVAEDESSLR